MEVPFDTSFFREEINKKEVEFERKTSNCIKCKKLQKRGCILCWKEVS